MPEEFVVVTDPSSNELVELPANAEDASLSVNTLKRAIPGAYGLKYKNPATCAFRALLLDDNGSKFLPPSDGWNEKVFTIIMRPPDIHNPPQFKEDPLDVFNSWKKRVFCIFGDKGQGSGVLISNKRILTAAHLSFRIDGTYNIIGIDVAFNAKVLFICNKFDSAVLTCESLPDVGIAPINVSRGDYFLMGYPDGADHTEPTITKGFMEGFMSDCIHLIGTPSAKRGFSGGPVLCYGSLAGILPGGLPEFNLDTTFREYLNSSSEQRYARILAVSNIITRFDGGQSDSES